MTAFSGLPLLGCGEVWEDTRDHDDLVWVSADGRTRLERLRHEECAREFPKEQTEWD
jgi:hypothetical protein